MSRRRLHWRRRRFGRRWGAAAAWPALGAVLLAGDCQRMMDQPRYDPFEASEFFADGMSARPLVAGTVPYRDPAAGPPVAGARQDGQLVERIPLHLESADLERGRRQFDIFCAPCHGAIGDGNGMIVQRGFTRPPSFHEPRLRAAPAGHFYEVITDGWGAMYSYAERVTPEDRWRIAAYIRALQLSQHAPVSDLPPEDRRRLEELP